jgi:phenylalanyl-tRNA synthetase beta chain
LNNEYDVLRAWMIPSMMEVLNTNLSREYPQNIFGVGDVFRHGNSDTGVIEQERLSVVLCNDNADFTKIMQAFDFLMRMIDAKYEIRGVEHGSFIPGRVGRVSVKGKDIAYIGEISPQVLSNFSIEMPTAAFEINVTELYELLKS